MQPKRNSPNPLIVAMKIGDPGNPNVRPALKKPRTITLDQSEVGEVKPGDPLTFYVYGRVKSVSKDGSIEGLVDYIKPEEEEDDDVEEEKPLLVRTQESHVP